MRRISLPDCAEIGQAEAGETVTKKTAGLVLSQQGFSMAFGGPASLDREPWRRGRAALALNETERWYVVHSLPRREAGTEIQLLAQGFRAFLPRIDTAWTAGAGASYTFWRNVALTFDYQFMRTDTNAVRLLGAGTGNGLGSNRQNLVTAGITYRY